MGADLYIRNEIVTMRLKKFSSVYKWIGALKKENANAFENKDNPINFRIPGLFIMIL
jgi:hypothetical protein